MDTSQANVKYLIKDDSSVVIPNQSYNSLYETQDTFTTNNLLSISNTQKPNQLATVPKKIVRGGYRLEPILYNQIYKTSTNLWAETINLYDNYVSGSVVNDWTAKIGMGYTSTEPHGYEEITANSIWVTLKHLNTTNRAGSAAVSNHLITTTPNQTSTYKVTNDIKSDAVDITFTVFIQASAGSVIGLQSVSFRIYNKTKLKQFGPTQTIFPPDNSNTKPNAPTGSISVTLLSNDIVDGDEYVVQVYTTFPSIYIESTSYFEITQTPIPTSDIPTTSLWISSSYPDYPTDSIYTTNPSLVSLFNIPNVKQLSMPTSSFPEVTEDWNVIRGDEFRFDGQESHTFMVKEAYTSGSSLIVVMDKPIPQYPAININHFLIRRYIPDASQVIFDGSISPQLVQPYLLKPQYVTENLNKNLQTIIPTLIKDGLIV